MVSIVERFKSAATVFNNPSMIDPGPSSFEGIVSTRATSRGGLFTSKTSVVSKIYNKIAVDVASASIRHIRVDQNDRYWSDIDSELSRCLRIRPNIDQTRRAFIQDVVLSMFEYGAAAIVPVDTDKDIRTESTFETRSIRVGEILDWYPQHVRVDLYNDRTGKKEPVVVPKNNIAIVTNPLYEVINKPNSDLNRLVEKLNLVDRLDKQTASGKLDLIIQLPYEVRSDLKREQARKRREDIENQLSNSQLGIAYIGATERVTQLNRAVTNNLLEQIQSLTKQVYNSLGLTEEVFNGTASEAVMLNYYNHTVNPILDEIVSALSWGMLSPKERSYGQRVRWFRSPFALASASQFAAITTQLITAEVATPNELRSELGWVVSTEERADQLRNPNVNPTPSGEEESSDPYADVYSDEYTEGYQNGI